MLSCSCFLSNLCATPTPATMVRHDRVQYREKEKETRERTEARRGRSFWSRFLYQYVKQRMQKKKKKKKKKREKIIGAV